MRTRGLGFAILLVACGGDDGGRQMMSTSVTLTSVGPGSTSDDATSTETPMTTDGSEGTSEVVTSSEGSEEVTGPPPPDSASCDYACSVAADCLVGGTSYGHTCQAGKCVVPCGMDDGCVGYFSGWLIEPCTASSDCEFDTCVAFGDGFSGCAFTPALGACADLGLQDVERMTVEGNTVTVCAEPNAACVDLGAGLECILPCTDFVECYMDQTGELCTTEGECVYACVGPEDCPPSNFDNVTPSCG